MEARRRWVEGERVVLTLQHMAYGSLIRLHPSGDWNIVGDPVEELSDGVAPSVTNRFGLDT